MINLNHEKSSSRAVYEYFTDKHEDIKTSNVRILICLCALVLLHLMQQWLRQKDAWIFLKGVVPSLVDSKDKGRVELILKYIEDADLRHWSLPDIKPFNIGLSEWRSRFSCISNPYMFKQV